MLGPGRHLPRRCRPVEDDPDYSANHMTRLIVAAAMVAIAAAGPAGARQLVHVITEGETLAGLAERYYGAPAFEGALRRHNALPPGEVRSGHIVLIPLATRHLVQEGESWEALALRYWEDAGLGAALAALAVPPHELKPGAEISIPVLLTHRVAAGENLATLSRHTYAGSDRAPDLAALNGLSDPNFLAVGQELRVPVLGRPPEVARADVPAVGATTLRPTSRLELEPPPLFSDALAQAIDAYYAGDLERARLVLESLRASVLAHGLDRERRLLLQHLVLIHAAAGETERACESWLGLRAVDVEGLYRPERLAPELVALLEGCEAQ